MQELFPLKIRKSADLMVSRLLFCFASTHINTGWIVLLWWQLPFNSNKLFLHNVLQKYSFKQWFDNCKISINHDFCDKNISGKTHA
jgi:hypothetical protein